MAEIEIERRPRRSPWTWVALLLVLAAVAVGAWLVFDGGVEGGDAAPAAERTEDVIEPLPGPATELPAEDGGAPMAPVEDGTTTSPDDPVSSPPADDGQPRP